jgi:hypothetical protein
MMSEAELLRKAEQTGFQAESLERGFRLFEILELLHSHPYLRQRIALKGGTGLNLSASSQDFSGYRPQLRWVRST